MRAVAPINAGMRNLSLSNLGYIKPARGESRRRRLAARERSFGVGPGGVP